MSTTEEHRERLKSLREKENPKRSDLEAIRVLEGEIAYYDFVEHSKQALDKHLIETTLQLLKTLKEGYDDTVDIENDDDRSLRDKFLKSKLMYLLYKHHMISDKVYDYYGRRLLPRAGGKVIGKKQILDQKGYLVNFKAIHSKPKDLGHLSKLVEKTIDQEIASWSSKV